MANIKVSNMPAATSVEDQDLLMIVQSGTNKKAPASLVRRSTGVTRVVDTMQELLFLTDLKENEKIQTLGYYSINDGGGAFYYITSDTTSSDYQVATSTQGLYARLILDNNIINVRQFGAKGDNVNDDTQSFRNAIVTAFNINKNSQYLGDFKGSLEILIPSGNYLINGSIIDSTLNVDFGCFTFVGNGKRTSMINCKNPFKNIGVFGYTEFNDIGFVGIDNTGTFMELEYVSGKQNPQSIVFNSCEFRYFKTITNATGDDLCSEITFNDCKIKYCGNNTNKCELFVINNYNSLNYRFYATDIELFNGKAFKLLSYTSITMFQSSFIAVDGSNSVFFDIDYTNAQNIPTSLPYIVNLYSVRFEIRNNKLINKIGNQPFKMIFNECIMGGYGITDSSIFAIDITNACELIFENCGGLNNYKINSVVNASLDAVNAQQKYNFTNSLNSVILEYILKNSNVNLTGSATYKAPIVYMDGCKLCLKNHFSDSKYSHSLPLTLVNFNYELNTVTSSEFFLPASCESIIAVNKGRSGITGTFYFNIYGKLEQNDSYTLVGTSNNQNLANSNWIEEIKINANYNYWKIEPIAEYVPSSGSLTLPFKVMIKTY